MKPTACRIYGACLVILLACALHPAARGQTRRPEARKFDEFTESTGSPYARVYYGDQGAERKAMEARMRRYAAQLRKEGARPYAVTYGRRVVASEGYGSSVAGRIASGLW